MISHHLRFTKLDTHWGCRTHLRQQVNLVFLRILKITRAVVVGAGAIKRHVAAYRFGHGVGGWQRVSGSPSPNSIKRWSLHARDEFKCACSTRSVSGHKSEIDFLKYSLNG